MKKLFLPLLAVLMLPCLLPAQTRMLTIEEASGLNRKLYPSSLGQLQWMGNSDNFAWVAKNKLIVAGVKQPTPDSLLSLDDLNAAAEPLGVEKLPSFPGITWNTDSDLFFISKGKVVLVNPVTKKAILKNSFDPEGENSDLETHGWKIAFTRGNNLFISSGSKEIALSDEKNTGIKFGQSVHRNEFGITKGTFWSPSGDLLAFYRMDETMVTDYPLVDIETRVASLKDVKYPMAGMTSHQVTVGIYDCNTGKTIFLKTGTPADQYLTNITWSPDEKYIYIAVLNREQDHMWLNKYDIRTGDFVRTLFEEQDKEYVEPLNGLFFLPGSSSQFLWLSRRDGYNHLYLYDTTGTLLKQLTRGAWEISDVNGFDEKGNTVFIMGNQDNPIGQSLFAVNLKTSKTERLTGPEGTHRDLLSGDGKYFLDIFNSLKAPSLVRLYDRQGKPLRDLLESPDPLRDFRLGETSVFTISNKENDALYCRLIKPVDFDPTKKYPVVIYVYGGPHSQLVTDSWLGGGGFFLNYLAEQGFAVFTLDNRGTSNRGESFEQAIFRKLGTAEVEDQMAGVRYLKSLPWVDSTRIGVNGWSYGGFMTLSMVLKNPGTFKVAVAGGPVIDWKFYEVMYGERYMDTPESNPDGYRNASLLNYVKNLNLRTLIIHGTLDETVVPQNSLTFLKKCVDEGIQLDYFVYPGHEHNVRGKDRAHLNRKITDYFLEHL